MKAARKSLATRKTGKKSGKINLYHPLPPDPEFVDEYYSAKVDDWYTGLKAGYTAPKQYQSPKPNKFIEAIKKLKIKWK